MWIAGNRTPGFNHLGRAFLHLMLNILANFARNVSVFAPTFFSRSLNRLSKQRVTSFRSSPVWPSRDDFVFSHGVVSFLHCPANNGLVLIAFFWLRGCAGQNGSVLHRKLHRFFETIFGNLEIMLGFPPVLDVNAK